MPPPLYEKKSETKKETKSIPKPEPKKESKSNSKGGSGRTNVDVSQYLEGHKLQDKETKYPKWFYQAEKWYIENKISRTEYQNIKNWLDR